MTDLRAFISHIMELAPESEKREIGAITAFLLDNNWFGCAPAIENGVPVLLPEQINILSEKLQHFLSTDESSKHLLKRLAERLPETAKYLNKYFEIKKVDEEDMFYLTDFLLFYLNKEVFFCTDKDVEELLKLATDNMIKQHGQHLTLFLAWLRTEVKTRYFKDYVMDKRYTMDIQNEAYSFDEYIELSYKLFNDAYMLENDMWTRAADSINYTDTWLFLALHFICSIRYTDHVRIHRPMLPISPEECIQQIAEDTFSDNDARYVLLSVTQRMCTLPLDPNKTDGTSGVGSVKLSIPHSCEALFGKLFALAEAHRQLIGDLDGPIIRKITKYEEITRYMGHDIGDLFLESDFRARSATKSYLQLVRMIGDEMSEENEGFHTKGYILAALARSHKGSYGEFAATTFEYLKDAKLNGLTPEFVAFELFERGVLSFMASALLTMVTDGKYSNMPTHMQTELIKELDLSPKEIESVVSLVDTSRRKAQSLVKSIVNSDKDPLLILHAIGSGEAFSKQPECLCLLPAIGKACPYADKRQCVGCDYEINTKSTMYLLISEYNRMKNLYMTANNNHEKNKYKRLITEVVTPRMSEMLECLRDTYGEDVFRQFEQMIKENT